LLIGPYRNWFVLNLAKEPILERNGPPFVQSNLVGAGFRRLCQPPGSEASIVVPVAATAQPASAPLPRGAPG
jgi:hypothetical protein